MNALAFSQIYFARDCSRTPGMQKNPQNSIYSLLNISFIIYTWKIMRLTLRHKTQSLFFYFILLCNAPSTLMKRYRLIWWMPGSITKFYFYSPCLLPLLCELFTHTKKKEIKKKKAQLFCVALTADLLREPESSKLGRERRYCLENWQGILGLLICMTKILFNYVLQMVKKKKMNRKPDQFTQFMARRIKCQVSNSTRQSERQISTQKSAVVWRVPHCIQFNTN